MRARQDSQGGTSRMSLLFGRVTPASTQPHEHNTYPCVASAKPLKLAERHHATLIKIYGLAQSGGFLNYALEEFRNNV
jgi:hypothetical protein